MPESSHRAWSIPPFLLKVGIPKYIFGVNFTLTFASVVLCLKHISANLLFGCIIVLLIVAYYFGVTLTLTSDYGLLKSCAEHFSYTTWHRNPILGIHYREVECCILFKVTVKIKRSPNVNKTFPQRLDNVNL